MESCSVAGHISGFRRRAASVTQRLCPRGVLLGGRLTTVKMVKPPGNFLGYGSRIGGHADVLVVGIC